MPDDRDVALIESRQSLAGRRRGDSQPDRRLGDVRGLLLLEQLLFRALAHCHHRCSLHLGPGSWVGFPRARSCSGAIAYGPSVTAPPVRVDLGVGDSGTRDRGPWTLEMATGRKRPLV